MVSLLALQSKDHWIAPLCLQFFWMALKIERYSYRFICAPYPALRGAIQSFRNMVQRLIKTSVPDNFCFQNKNMVPGTRRVFCDTNVESYSSRHCTTLQKYKDLFRTNILIIFTFRTRIWFLGQGPYTVVRVSDPALQGAAQSDRKVSWEMIFDKVS